MSEYINGFNNLSLNYLPAFNTGSAYSFDNSGLFNFSGMTMPDFSSYSSGCGLFPMNMTNFLMPEFSSFGGLDSFGISSAGFNFMQEFFQAQQQQNMMSQMWNNFMNLVKDYKMPQIDFTNFLKPSGSVNSGYGNYNQKATDLYKGTAEDLNKNLKGVMKGKGEKLLELQNKYGISAALLAAIVNNESAHGTSDAAVNLNNVAGIMSAKSNYMQLAKFDSVDDCLEALAKNLKNNYVDEGLVTISQIYEKYCPIGASNDPKGMNGGWGKTVASLMDDYNNLA